MSDNRWEEGFGCGVVLTLAILGLILKVLS